MTITEAKAAIGKKFKHKYLKFKPDVIVEVHDSGTVVGNFLMTDAEDIRLVGDQPEQLKKKKKPAQDTGDNTTPEPSWEV